MDSNMLSSFSLSSLFVFVEVLSSLEDEVSLMLDVVRESEVPLPETLVIVMLDPVTLYPETLDPEALVPEILESEKLVPEILEPETLEPETLEPEMLEPETLEPVMLEPDMLEPELEMLVRETLLLPPTLLVSVTLLSLLLDPETLRPLEEVITLDKLEVTVPDVTLDVIEFPALLVGLMGGLSKDCSWR